MLNFSPLSCSFFFKIRTRLFSLIFSTVTVDLKVCPFTSGQKLTVRGLNINQVLMIRTVKFKVSLTVRPQRLRLSLVLAVSFRLWYTQSEFYLR